MASETRIVFLNSEAIRVHSCCIRRAPFEPRFFKTIEAGSPAGPRKADGIRAILDSWDDIDKTAIIYVGDAPGDITASKEAGVAVVSAAWAETADPELLKSMDPDQIFYTIEEFAKWLFDKTAAA